MNKNDHNNVTDVHPNEASHSLACRSHEGLCHCSVAYKYFPVQSNFKSRTNTYNSFPSCNLGLCFSTLSFSESSGFYHIKSVWGGCIIYLTIFQFCDFSTPAVWRFFFFTFFCRNWCVLHASCAHAEIRSNMAFPLGGGGANRPAWGVD